MDAVLDAMESDSGGPSRTIFPSHMAEVAASSVAGDATKTRKGESTAGATVGDAGLAGYRVRGDGRVDQVLEEGRALELQEVEKLMTTDSSTSTKARDIRSLMIHKASVKLPRDVHRAILDLFQVTILEPDYYPPDAELEVSACVCRCVNGQFMQINIWCQNIGELMLVSIFLYGDLNEIIAYRLPPTRPITHLFRPPATPQTYQSPLPYITWLFF